MAAKKTPRELYLKIPYHILNIRALGLCEKVLLAHIYSFGEKGCWQSNATLAKIFMTSPRTVSRWVANLSCSGLIQKKSPKGYYRTMWAKSHPNVKQASHLWYRKQEVQNPDRETPVHRAKTCIEGTTKLRGQCAKSGNRLRKNWRTTNNKTIKETTVKTTAPPSPPLPKGAPAVLVERKRAALESVEQFKNRFGLGRQAHQPLSDKEFEKSRQKQRKALLAVP